MSRCAGARLATDRSSKRMSPPLIDSMPATIFRVELLPQPDGPSSASISPCGQSRLSSRTASTSPYFFQTDASRMDAIATSAASGWDRRPASSQAANSILVSLYSHVNAFRTQRGSLRRPRRPCSYAQACSRLHSPTNCQQSRRPLRCDYVTINRITGKPAVNSVCLSNAHGCRSTGALKSGRTRRRRDLASGACLFFCPASPTVCALSISSGPTQQGGDAGENVRHLAADHRTVVERQKHLVAPGPDAIGQRLPARPRPSARHRSAPDREASPAAPHRFRPTATIARRRCEQSCVYFVGYV